MVERAAGVDDGGEVADADALRASLLAPSANAIDCRPPARGVATVDRGGPVTVTHAGGRAATGADGRGEVVVAEADIGVATGAVGECGVIAGADCDLGVATGSVGDDGVKVGAQPGLGLATGADGGYEGKVGTTQHRGVGVAVGAVSECEVADATAERQDAAQAGAAGDRIGAVADGDRDVTRTRGGGGGVVHR